MDAARRHGTAFILQQRIKFAAREVQSEAKRSRKQKRTE